MHNPVPDPRIRVAVIFGGRSTEHDVSRGSARSVLRFLDPGRYDVLPVLIGRDGAWSVVGADAASEEPPTPGNHEHPDGGGRAARDGQPAAGGEPVLASIVRVLGRLREVDVVLPCLHGPYGEDGTLQGLLESAGIPYVGSGVLASAAAMDKEFAKKIVAAEGIAVAPGVVLRPGADDVTAADRERLGLPVFVKPARGGSSVGVTRVDDWAALPAAIAAARTCDSKVLVEAAVIGREIDVALLQDPGGEVVAGPALEIKVGSGSAFFDFDAKYRDAAATFVIPADLDAGTAELLADTARRVFEALGCAGLLRADFFLTTVDGRPVPVFNEVNTLPGLTEHSQFPQIWQTAGLPYAALLDRLIATASAQGRP